MFAFYATDSSSNLWHDIWSPEPHQGSLLKIGPGITLEHYQDWLNNKMNTSACEDNIGLRNPLLTSEGFLNSCVFCEEGKAEIK